ncbi:MAG: N-acetylmannosamine-6-phosphate 2-epimerase [Acidobacteriota bacterium]|nr:N-acetylmannosamine-6-phosphate 2-epimerase [Acidobacteriota bacterium]
MNTIFEKWRGGLIVSCQAPAGSPLARPEIIAAFAEVAEQNGAVGVRIDAPENIVAVKSKIKIPVLGIYKIIGDRSQVYITPTFDSAAQIAAANADVIALDATLRVRPNDEKIENIIRQIRDNFNQPIAADIATFDEGVKAQENGFDAVITTLSGYTDDTKHILEPDFALVEKLAKKLSIPLICEGRLSSAEDVKRAFDCGAFAVVVGGAITGVDNLVRKFAAALPANNKTSVR